MSLSRDPSLADRELEHLNSLIDRALPVSRASLLAAARLVVSVRYALGSWACDQVASFLTHSITGGKGTYHALTVRTIAAILSVRLRWQ